jgi:hypothetical protein
MYRSRFSHIGVWLLPSDSNWTHLTRGMFLKSGASVQSAAVSCRPLTIKVGTVIWCTWSTIAKQDNLHAVHDVHVLEGILD